MQTNLVAQRVNLTQLANDLALKWVVELPVHQHEERRLDPSRVFQSSHLQGMVGSKIYVVAQRDIALGQGWASR
jgi:hypothetical protein